MVKRILFNMLLWIHTKVLLILAFFYFGWHLNKNLKSKIKNNFAGDDLSKNKSIASGSNERLDDLYDDEDGYSSIEDLKIDVEDIEKALTKLLGPEAIEILESEASTPIFVLSLDTGVEFFYSMNRKSFVQIRNGTEVIPVFEDVKKSKVIPGFYLIENEVFTIDPKKVICLGWN